MKKLAVLLVMLCAICLIGLVSCSQDMNPDFPEWLIGSWDTGSTYSIIDMGAGNKKAIIITNNSVKISGSYIYDASDSLYTNNYKVSVSDNEVVIESKADSKVYYKFIKEGVGKVVLKIANGYSTSTTYLKNESAHEHVYSTEWTSDETYHWHAAICGHAEVKDKAAHTNNGTVCTVCGYDSHGHTFSSEWTSDDNTHWHEATCGHDDVKGEESAHTFGPDVVTVEPTCKSAGSGYHTCTVCGKTVTFSIPLVPENHNLNSDGVCTLCSLHKATGLYVFYDKGEYSDGWRYLEAAPADLRVVNDIPTVDSKVKGYSNASYRYHFGYYGVGNNYYFVNGTKVYDPDDCTGTAVGTGKANTRLLVDTMGNEASYGSGSTSEYAARLCDILTYTVNGVTYDDWFLPSKDELYLMYQNRDKIGEFNGGPYFTSSEDSSKSSGSYIWLK